MSFGERIKELRKQRKMGVRELAAMAGMGHTHLSRIENGLRPAPEVHHIFGLADALGVTEENDISQLLELATESQGDSGTRLTDGQLQRFRDSKSLQVFTRMKPGTPREGRRSDKKPQ